LEFNSLFESDVNKVDEENHVYLKDGDLGERFLEEKYKIGLFRYFAKYAKDFYDRGVNEWSKQFEGMREAFKETNQDDDALVEFVKCFVKDDNKMSVISKADMLIHLENETGDEFIRTVIKKDEFNDNIVVPKYINFNKLKNEFKKLRFKYESQEKSPIPGKKSQKGIFLNIKYVGTAGKHDSE
jgi:hypothetical protein